MFNAFQYTALRNTLRKQIAGSLFRNTAAEERIFFSNLDSLTLKDAPAINIFDAPVEITDENPRNIRFMVSGLIAEDPAKKPQLDPDCGLCLDPLVEDAQDFELEILEQLHCIGVCPGTCGMADISPATYEFRKEGSRRSVVLRIVVTYKYVQETLMPKRKK